MLYHLRNLSIAKNYDEGLFKTKIRDMIWFFLQQEKSLGFVHLILRLPSQIVSCAPKKWFSFGIINRKYRVKITSTYLNCSIQKSLIEKIGRSSMNRESRKNLPDELAV